MVLRIETRLDDSRTLTGPPQTASSCAPIVRAATRFSECASDTSVIQYVHATYNIACPPSRRSYIICTLRTRVHELRRRVAVSFAGPDCPTRRGRVRRFFFSLRRFYRFAIARDTKKCADHADSVGAESPVARYTRSSGPARTVTDTIMITNRYAARPPTRARV